MILTILSISSIKMTKVIPFPLLTSLPRIFLRIAPSVSEVDAIVGNNVSTFLAKETATFVNRPAN